MKLLLLLLCSFVSHSHAALFNPLKVALSALQSQKNLTTKVSDLCACMQKEKTTNDAIIESIKTGFTTMAADYKKNPDACAKELEKARAQSLRAIESQEDFLKSLIKERNERGGCAFINAKTRVWCPRYPEHQENERISQLEINTPCLCIEKERETTAEMIQSIEAGFESRANAYQVNNPYCDNKVEIEKAYNASQIVIKRGKDSLNEFIQSHKQRGGCALHNPKTKVQCPHNAAPQKAKTN